MGSVMRENSLSLRGGLTNKSRSGREKGEYHDSVCDSVLLFSTVSIKRHFCIYTNLNAMQYFQRKYEESSTDDKSAERSIIMKLKEVKMIKRKKTETLSKCFCL